jgi:hypothetical protein
MFDLIPSEKPGPLGRVNVTFEECIFRNNFGGTVLFGVMQQKKIFK